MDGYDENSKPLKNNNKDEKTKEASDIGKKIDISSSSSEAAEKDSENIDNLTVKESETTVGNSSNFSIVNEAQVASLSSTSNEENKSSPSDKLFKSIGEGDEENNSHMNTGDEHGGESEAKKEKLETDATTEIVNFFVISNKNKHDVGFSLSRTVGELKSDLENQIGIPPSMQKLMLKGQKPSDDKTLLDAGITKGCKVMVVGTTMQAIIDAETRKDDAVDDAITGIQKPEPLCKQKIHKKILDKGKPDDVLPGIKNIQEPLPTYPISGMVNKYGGKVRLTFKLELDQIWIGTKERTEKVRMGSIKNIKNEAIEGYEEYHIMGLQMGPTEASRYWIYWVPAQYTDAIHQVILGGKFMFS